MTDGITRRQWNALAFGATASSGLYAFTAAVPRKAGEVTVGLDFGAQILLSSLRGKVVALEFLLTTCAHCKQCSGILQQMYRECGPRGFQPVGAAVNDNARQFVPEFVHSLGLTYPVGVTPHEKAYEFLGFNINDLTAGPVFFPQLVFIDRKGVVRGQYGYDADFFRNEEANMRNMVETLLKEPGAARPGAGKRS